MAVSPLLCSTLRTARLRQGLSIAEAAQRCGLTFAQYYLRERQSPVLPVPDTVLGQLADGLDLDVGLLQSLAGAGVQSERETAGVS